VPVKVLILAYDFPPLVSVGGLRPYSWYRYLKEFGAEPVVVTRQWSNEHGNELDYVAPVGSQEVVVEKTGYGTIIRTPYRPNLSNRLLLKYGPSRFRLLRKAVTAWYEVGQYYSFIGPKHQLYYAAREYLKQHPCDVIVATGEPFVLFRYALKLSREFGIPWVADYRDPWTQNKRRAGQRISEGWDARLEKRFTGSASAVTTVSEFFRDVISGLVPDKPFHIVPNGYDPEAMERAAEIEQSSEKLTIAFVGRIYDWYPVESFFRVCDAFVRARGEPRFELRFVGINGQEQIADMLRTRFPALAPHVVFNGRMPNEEAAKHLARANAFLLFNNYTYTGTKIYDYLALKRRVLLCYSDDPEARRLKEKHYHVDDSGSADQRALESLVNETCSGTVVRDAAHLGQVLEEMYEEFLAHGRIVCNSAGTEEYSRRTQARRMADILKRLATK